MEDQDRIMDEIKKLSQKIDDMPNVIRAEIRSTVISFGLDPDRPLEIQKTMQYVQQKMSDSDQAHRKKLDVYLGLAYKAIVVIILGGALAFYMENIVATAVKKELGIVDNRKKIEMVLPEPEKK
jgi:hypothetical protein